MNTVVEAGLSDQVFVLGFIPREHLIPTAINHDLLGLAVMASEATPSRGHSALPGSLRRCAPRDDESMFTAAGITALYRASTALVFPSYFGPDNFPPLEAFSLGCPVIAANVPGAIEQMANGALLFEPSDPSDIAAKIESLYRMPSLRAQLIGSGNEIAKNRTPQAFIATLCAFLDRFESFRRCWGGIYYHP